MLKIGHLAKKLSRSFLEFPPKDIGERASIYKKFISSKDVSSYINEIDISNTSASTLVYSLKVSLNDPQKRHLEIESSKIYEIKNEIENNLDKLDAQDIVDYCEWARSFPMRAAKLLFSQEKKTMLIDCINKLLLSKSFNRDQILSLYGNLDRKSIWINELENEVMEIIEDPSALTLAEILKIFVGCDKYINSKKLNFVKPCLERIIQLFNHEKLDEKCLAKIFDILATNLNNKFFDENQTINKFLEVVRVTLPRWNKDDLLSIINFHVKHDGFQKATYKYALGTIYKSLSNEESIVFAIKLTFLLKEDTKNLPIIDKILSKSLSIIKSKLCESPISIYHLGKILVLMYPNVDYQTSRLLVNKLENIDGSIIWRLDRFKKASEIRVNKEGKLSLLTDYISSNFNYKDLENKSYYWKFNAFNHIVNTKEAKFHHSLQEIKSHIIEDFKKWIYENVIGFCKVNEEMRYSSPSKLIKALKPLLTDIYSSLESQNTSSILKYSMLFYKCDPEIWKEFVTKNKYKFSFKEVLIAIKYDWAPFEAINDLLEIYSDNLSKIHNMPIEELEQDCKSLCKEVWLAAIKRVAETQNFEVLNTFARILNQMDPDYLINDPGFYDIYNFDHLYLYSDFFLLTDLFVGAYNIIKKLPIEVICNSSNIRIISYVAEIDKLDSKIADLIAENYTLVPEQKLLELLKISSKLSNQKLREIIVKRVFNTKIPSQHVKLAILRYWSHPETKEIDDYVISFLKEYIPSLDIHDGIHRIIWTLYKLSEININSHRKLFNTMSILIKNYFLKNIGNLSYQSLEILLNLAEKQLDCDIDFANIISENQNPSKSSYKSENIRDYLRDQLIEKITTVGLSDKNAVLAFCDKKYDFKPSYLAGSLSCLADLRFEGEKWAIDMANTLINYEERKKIAFDSEKEYINWIYGLIAFKANKSSIMRHLENSAYFNCEQLTFKHILLKNHFNLDSDYNGEHIIEKKIQENGQDFDYFKHFGIQKSLITSIQSKFNKDDLMVQTGEFVENIWVPFYIPSIKVALWPVTNSILLYRSDIFRGEFAMHQVHILKKIKNLKILYNEDTKKLEKVGIKKFLNIS